MSTHCYNFSFIRIIQLKLLLLFLYHTIRFHGRLIIKHYLQNDDAFVNTADGGAQAASHICTRGWLILPRPPALNYINYFVCVKPTFYDRVPFLKNHLHRGMHGSNLFPHAFQLTFMLFLPSGKDSFPVGNIVRDIADLTYTNLKRRNISRAFMAVLGSRRNCRLSFFSSSKKKVNLFCV